MQGCVFSATPAHHTNNGHDFSYGVGGFGRLMDVLSIGASFQSRGYMTEFEDYEGLLAEEGEFDIPPVITLGLALNLTPEFTVALDIQHIILRGDRFHQQFQQNPSSAARYPRQ